LLFEPHELETMRGQLSMFAPDKKPVQKRKQEAIPGRSPAPGGEPRPAMSPPSPTSPLEGLNPEQRAAATSKATDIAVIAGPGTGKTKTLVARLAYLLEELKASPAQITAVTFTRQAAAEMRERLHAALGEDAIHGLTIGTFHSICLGLLNPKPLIGEAQALEILRELLDARGSDALPLPTLRKISLAKNGKSFGEADLDESLYAAYCARLAAMGVRDLDDLLLQALGQDDHGKPMFTHLLVDEFQDVSRVQHKLIRHWRTFGQSLFVIGDPDQSIYGFRGANAACFADLKREVATLETISLEQNYRSAPGILKSALAVISHNSGEARHLQANRPEGAPVRLMNAQTPFDANPWIAKEIGRMVGGVDMLSASSGGMERHARRSFSDIAVLCRTRRQLEQIEACLARDDIPCVIFGREDYLSDKKVVGALSFFGSLLHPENPALLMDCLRIVWRVPKALSQRAVHAMAYAAQEDGLEVGLLKSHLEAFGPLSPWLDAIDAYYPLLYTEKPRLLLERFAEEYGNPPAMRRLMRASVFHETMEHFWQTLLLGQESDIYRAGKAVALPMSDGMENPRKDYALDAVKLMTLHGSKGLEFPVVFLVADGMAGQDLAVEALEEERRLFFVGMTRAKEELILTSSEESLCFLREVEGTVQAESLHKRKALPQMEQQRLF
jgi:superfamily I DNA/RNA helicase